MIAVSPPAPDGPRYLDGKTPIHLLERNTPQDYMSQSVWVSCEILRPIGWCYPASYRLPRSVGFPVSDNIVHADMFASRFKSSQFLFLFSDDSLLFFPISKNLFSLHIPIPEGYQLRQMFGLCCADMHRMQRGIKSHTRFC